jgi:hypothetical protein
VTAPAAAARAACGKSPTKNPQRFDGRHSGPNSLWYHSQGADNANMRIPKQMIRKILSLAAFAALLSVTSFNAHAEGGCGPLEYRGPGGHCRLKAVVVAPPVVVAPAPVVVAPVGVVCGPGLRWHPGRRRCWAY